ncbi:hypothetical protein K7432_004600 [Basidiobolus ranarum]|uniref:Uncharacterized protein n=1 Tax=Basidiobolus ranarum TaxID=34480 RepID=A0ABR2W4D2_9FUNG
MSGSPVFGFLEQHKVTSSHLKQTALKNEMTKELFISRTPSPSPEPLPSPSKVPNFYFDDVAIKSPNRRENQVEAQQLMKKRSPSETTFQVKGVLATKHSYRKLEKDHSNQVVDSIRNFCSTPKKSPNKSTINLPKLRNYNQDWAKTPKHIAVSALLGAVRSPRNNLPQAVEEISVTSSEEENSLAEYAKDRLVSPEKVRKKKPGIVFQSPTKLPLHMGTPVKLSNTSKKAASSKPVLRPSNSPTANDIPLMGSTQRRLERHKVSKRRSQSSGSKIRLNLSPK